MKVAVLVLILGICSLAALAGDSADYLLVPQDSITITVLKHTELSGTFTVPPDGAITFPRAGRIFVVGKTTSQVAAEISAGLGKELRDPEVTAALAQMHEKYAYAIGLIARPGRYPLTRGARVTELLAQAGDIPADHDGLTARLIRNTQAINLNLPALLEGNDPAGNQELQDGDILSITRSSHLMSVTVSGQVRTPGKFKLAEQSSLIEALIAAGEVTDRPERMEFTLVRGAQMLKLSWGDKTQQLQDGDIILVEREASVRVYVNGHVAHPGVYEMAGGGGGVLQAIALAGGLLGNPALSQVTIIRHNGTVEHVNMAPALVQGDATQNPQLGPDDQVIIPESQAKYVVLGKVHAPGTYPLSDLRVTTVVDALSQAGGEVRRASLAQVAVIRMIDGKLQRIPVNVVDIMKKGNTVGNIKLEPDDIVFVPETNSPDWTAIIGSVSGLRLPTTLKK